MRVTRTQLLVAVSLAGLVHAAVAATVFWVPPSPGARAVGLGGIEVSLGPAGGAPGAAAAPTPDVAEAPAVEPIEAPTVEAAEARADPAPEGMPIETALPTQVAEARPVVPPPPKPPPKRKRPEPERIAPPPASAEPPQEVMETAKPAREVVASTAPSVAGAGGKAGTRARPDAGSDDATSGGGSPSASADYMSYLQAWLQKHKEYPRAAQRRQQQGTALLYFEMDREGRVRDARLRRSSGHEALDREVLALIRRAAPLPPPPPDVGGERIKLVVPVQFFLR